MFFQRMVLCLTLILASTSFAQAAGDVPLAGPWDAASPHDDLFQSRGRRGSYREPPALRVLAEVGGGVLGGALMGLVGLAVGQKVVDDTSCQGDCTVLMGVVAAPVALLGIPGGVASAGQAMDGRGGVLPTFAGTLVGLGAGIGLLVALKTENKPVIATSLVAGPLLGSIVGFELSHALNSGRRGTTRIESSSGLGLRVAPVAGMTQRGGFLGGLSGSF